MISGNRFIFFNADIVKPDSNVVFDGTITSIIKSDLVGTATIYQAGQVVSTGVAVTGTVTSRSRVQLTFALAKGDVGSLVGDFSGGSVDGTFDIVEYDKGAAQTTIDSQSNAEWGTGTNSDRNVYMKIPGMETSITMSRTDDTYRFDAYRISVTNARDCILRGGIVGIPDVAVNVYSVTGGAISRASTSSTCPDLDGTSGYTGFAAVVDDANNGIWYVVTNKKYSIFAILSRP